MILFLPNGRKRTNGTKIKTKDPNQPTNIPFVVRFVYFFFFFDEMKQKYPCSCYVGISNTEKNGMGGDSQGN